MFDREMERVRELYSRLQGLQSLNLTFEERFHVEEFGYRLEQLLSGKPVADRPGRYIYCFFVNQNGVRYAQIDGMQAEVARKIKGQLPLALAEKAEALHLLRRLAV